MMAYRVLFTLEIVHAYYSDTRCPDFDILPTPATQKTLRGLRATLKPFANGLRVLIPLDDEGAPLVAIPQGALFSFQLRLRNPNFALFSDLDAYNQLPVPLFNNQAAPQGPDLALVSRQASSVEQLSVQNPSTQEPFVLGGRPLANLKPADFLLQGLGKVTSPKDFDPATRTLKINTAKAAPGTPFSISYPIQPSLEAGVFADVEIYLPPFQAAPAAFRIAFAAQQARWKYYLITNRRDGKTVDAVLEDKDQNLIFPPAERTDLNLNPDPSDQVAQKLAETYPNRQYFRFRSHELVPCQEAARKNIQLQLDGEMVLAALSNPRLSNYSFDARDSSQEYALYQVVEYFTR